MCRPLHLPYTLLAIAVISVSETLAADVNVGVLAGKDKLPSNSSNYVVLENNVENGYELSGSDRIGYIKDNALVTSFGKEEWTKDSVWYIVDTKVTWTQVNAGTVTPNVKVNGTLTIKDNAQVVLGGQYKYNDSSAIATLKARRGVCQGISNLTVAMLRSIGIVAYGLSCYALGISTTGGWDTVENMKALPNHQMTIAYVDNRWMIMDVTWDSDNIYINGKYTQKSGCGVSHKYFDNTIPFLSYTHRLMTNN